MKIAVIGDERMVWGFSLAGLKEGMITDSAHEAADAISRWVRDPGIGIILISLPLADTIRPYLTRVRLEKRLYPLILELGETGGISGFSSRVEEELLRMVGMTTGESG